jgi:hypothetical protein
MRTIEQTGQFKRDYKREAKGLHRTTLAGDFMASSPHWRPTIHWLQSIVTMP